MAKTAVVNPRRHKRSKSGSSPRRRRRRNYGAAAAPRNDNPRRRRRRRHAYAGARTHVRRRRRRNPGVQRVYSSGGYRKKNPGMFDIDSVTDTLPAATGGIWAARWAVNMAGPMDAGEKKDEPGIKHALAIWLAASFGGQLIGQVFGSSAKGDFARIAALGWGGDLFMRKRFLRDNEWVNKNLTLAGVDDPDDVWGYAEEGEVSGFQAQSALGDSFVDAVGNRYVKTAQGWALAGMGEPQFVQDESGQIYQLGAGETYHYPSDYNAIMADAGMGVAADPSYGRGTRLAGFQSQSALGALGVPRARPSGGSFGYA
jgi:hypothetical protein